MIKLTTQLGSRNPYLPMVSVFVWGFPRRAWRVGGTRLGAKMQSLESDKVLVTAWHGMGMAICASVQSVSIDFELHTYIIHSQYYTLVKHDRGTADRVHDLFVGHRPGLLVGIQISMSKKYIYGPGLS